MANRRRGAFSLPEELRTNEKISTKKELAQRRLAPSCPPVIYKRKRNNLKIARFGQPKPIYFSKPTNLSPLYNPQIKQSYFDQIYQKNSILGEGSFGIVYKTVSREDGDIYAIKRSKKVISTTDTLAEIKNNEKVGFDFNCVRFFMAWEEFGDVYLKLECCEMCLSNFANKISDIPEELLWNVLYDMCKALHYLHIKNFIHLDVKPANIMIKNGYYKLGDFGILVDLKNGPGPSKSSLSDGDSKYLALEVLDGVYTPSCDIFGLGITLLELAADLELPDHGPLWQQLRHNHLPSTFYERVTLGFVVIIERMLAPVYTTRPSAEKILKFACVRAIEKNDLKNPRTDFVDLFFNNLHVDDGDREIIKTPPHNNNNVLMSYSPVEFEENIIKKPQGTSSGRKSLNFSSVSDDSNADSLSPEFVPLGDSAVWSDMSKCEDNMFTCHDSNEESGFGSDISMDLSTSTGNLNISTPILKRNVGRKLPKSKLTFDF